MVSAADRPSTSDALIGRTIAGKYTIESRVGGGGMGSVYRARQAGLDKIVAVKVLHRELLAEATFATRFKREATSASRIDHPSSLRVLDFGEEPDGTLYIAMEYLEGRTLFKILREEAPLAPRRIVDLSRQILAALAAAHELGIVHRDLKPENVIVLRSKDDEGDAAEHVKVCDFGIAKLQARGEADEKLTVEGSIVGTPEYLSPEQARGGELDARSDLYSMGVIVFEMLTGQPPFRGDSPLAIVLKHLDAPPPLPSSLTPTVDPKLEAVCLKALSKLPGDRFASARDMRAALQTDTPDAVAPPATLHAPLLMMTETPPPVSSTQVPVPLMSKRPSALASGSGSGSQQRVRLSDMSDQGSGGSNRSMLAVIGIALLVGAGGGGAYWMQHTSRAPAALAHEGPTIAPSVTAPVAAEVPALPPSAAPIASNEPALPPSELSLPASSATSSHHHHRSAANSSGKAVEDKLPAEGEHPPVATDLAPAPPPPTTVANVHFSHIQVAGIAATNLTGALPGSRLARCYHAPPGSHASVTVHLDLKKAETVARCQISDPSLADLAACVDDAVKQVNVSGLPESGASADVQIDFDVP